MMNNNLIMFEGNNIEILTKQDVNVEFEGDVLFHSKQVATMLGYSNTNDAVLKHTKEKYRTILKNSNIAKCDFRNLANRGEGFLTDKGVFALIMNSKLPSAEKFQDLVFDIVMQVKQTGKFDMMEQHLSQIEDEKERELSLGLYSLQQALQTNPNDHTLSILCNNRQIELNQYKQEKQLTLIQQEQKQIKQQVENMFIVGDRVQFTNEVKSVVRATGVKHSEVYGLTYSKLKDIYAIDLEQRSKNKKEQIQNERIDSGKKPYSPKTLETKASKMIIADELDAWRELSLCLNSVKNELLEQNK